MKTQVRKNCWSFLLQKLMQSCSNVRGRGKVRARVTGRVRVRVRLALRLEQSEGWLGMASRRAY